MTSVITITLVTNNTDTHNHVTDQSRSSEILTILRILISAYYQPMYITYNHWLWPLVKVSHIPHTTRDLVPYGTSKVSIFYLGQEVLRTVVFIGSFMCLWIREHFAHHLNFVTSHSHFTPKLLLLDCQIWWRILNHGWPITSGRLQQLILNFDLTLTLTYQTLTVTFSRDAQHLYRTS